MPAGAIEAGRALGIPKATVFEANAGELGLLPLDACRAVIDFYGIRTAAEAVLDAAEPVNRRVLLGWLSQAANSAPQSLMALDLFLKRPQQNYGMISGGTDSRFASPQRAVHPRCAMIPEGEIWRRRWRR
jgi:hypothetical protein